MRGNFIIGLFDEQTPFPERVDKIFKFFKKNNIIKLVSIKRANKPSDNNLF